MKTSAVLFVVLLIAGCKPAPTESQLYDELTAKAAAKGVKCEIEHSGGPAHGWDWSINCTSLHPYRWWYTGADTRYLAIKEILWELDREPESTEGDSYTISKETVGAK